VGEAPDARPVRIQKNDRVVLVRNGIHPEIPRGSKGTAAYIATMMGGDVYVNWDDGRAPCYFTQSCLAHLSAVDQLAELV